MNNINSEKAYAVFKNIIASRFDSGWYLNAYPDVAQANIDPLTHYLNHGRYECRWPYKLYTLELEKLLYEGEVSDIHNKLEFTLDKNPDVNLEVIHAAWILASWHSVYNRWPDAYKYMQIFNSSLIAKEFMPHLGPVLLEFTALNETGKIEEAKQLIKLELTKRGMLPDLLLAASSVSTQNKSILLLNEIFKTAELNQLSLHNTDKPLNLDNIDSNYLDQFNTGIFHKVFNSLYHPTVSIIIPTHNSNSTLSTSLRSILRQSWKYLDIIIVDDASTDNTHEIAKSFAISDPRIRIIKNDYNQGAYASRNKGLLLSKGKYITTHDSDDWSHPQKIELQVKALESNKNFMACISHWVRCTPDMKFSHWRIENKLIYRNISSLMFRRSIFKKLGLWDRVRVGADTEYLQRIEKVFGINSINDVLPGIPLAFGRHEPDSLSQNSETHLRTAFKGLRRDYQEASQIWHEKAIKLYLPKYSISRPFPIPLKQRIPPHEDTIKQHYSLIQKSNFFNKDWYLRKYPDIAQSGDDPVMHYILHGGYEGRDPGPDFTSSGYTYLYLQKYPEIINPLAHYLTVGHQQGNQTLPLIDGSIILDETKKTILVCAHSSGKYIYGAERSLLDILNGMVSIGINVVVTIPEISNTDYLNALCERSCYVKVIPYSWWKRGNNQVNETVGHFNELISKFNIDAVYANTLMLWEPLISSKLRKIPNFIHIRELPQEDPDLCNVLNADPEQIRNHVHVLADNIIANSKAVATDFDLPDKTHVVHNLINLDQFDMVNSLQNGHTLIAMISSNLPKKGIEDFILMAKQLSAINPNIECILIGPDNEHIQQLLQNERPDNLQITGYLSSPQEAISRANIIVNLSHFQESFGRTILEAMAARRCVIGYNWGALPELIKDGENGYLVPFRDIQSLVDKVVYLHNNPSLIIKMGEKGRVYAESNYGFNQFSSQLKIALNEIV